MKDLPSKFQNKIKNLSLLANDRNNELKYHKAELESSIAKKEDSRGRHEKKLDECLGKLGMTAQKYFGGEAMVGNKVHLGYESFRRGADTLVQCFNDELDLIQKFTRIYEILASIDTFFQTLHQQNRRIKREQKM